MAAFPSYIVELQSSNEDVTGGNGNNGNGNAAGVAPEKTPEAEQSYSRSAAQLNMSASAKRSLTIPRCPPRPQANGGTTTTTTTNAGPTSSSSSPRRVTSRVVSGQTAGVTTMNNVTAIGGLPEFAEPRDRALQMLFTYPIMKVANTAFENGLRVTHRSSQNQFTRLHNMHAAAGAGNTNGPMENWTLNNASLTFDAAMLNSSMTLEMSTFLDMSLTLRNPNEEERAGTAGGEATAKPRGENVVRTATVLKRGAMWQTVLVLALAQRTLLHRFRVERLCRILRIYLLPVLLRRREETGSILPDELQRRGNGAQSGTQEGTTGGPNAADVQQLHGIYLKEHHTFLAELNNSALLQLLAETMQRQRFMPGEVIARPDTPSQQRIYFLISGKCEVTPELNARDMTTGNNPTTTTTTASSPSPTVAVPTTSTAAPQTTTMDTNSSGAHAAATSTAPLSQSRPRKQILLSGDCFGGIFRAETVFGATYKALTQCIVWTLEADDFERVFRAAADEAMLTHYTETFRTLHLNLLQQRYPIAAVLPRVPVYRLLDNALERYAADFTPLVKVRGEVLFEQGDSPTQVYCLVEGSVVRSVRGHDGSYASGASQLLTTNGFTNFNIRNRFILLGDEPLILPCQQRYRCTVQSRAALLFSIPGDRFVGALLDDPVLYVALREKLTQQIRTGMRLDKACLTHTAMLRAFPEAARQALAAAAEPRVVHRSIAICEPVRQLKEVYLVVRGEVRDARLYSRRPSLPLATPSTSDAEGLDDDDDDGGHENRNRGFVPRLPLPGHFGTNNNNTNSSSNSKERRHGAAGNANAHHAAQGGTAGGGGGNATAQSNKGKSGRTTTQQQQQQSNVRGKRSSQQSDQTAEPMDHLNGGWHNARNGNGANSTQPWQFALLDAAEIHTTTTTTVVTTTTHAPPQRTPNDTATNNTATAGANAHRGSDLVVNHCTSNGVGELPYVSPDEQQELNPPLPPCPDTHFRYSLGASWAGLLVDKWPNGWEAVTLVEMWAIPTVQLRMQFNNCPKAVQNVILAAARQAQKESLGLPAIQIAKLPPMKSYLPPEGTVAPVPARDEGSAPSSSRGRGASRIGSSNNNTMTSKRLTSRSNATHSLASTTSPRTTRGPGSLAATRSVGNAMEENSLSGEPMRSPRGASLTGATAAHTAVFLGGTGNGLNTMMMTSDAFGNVNSANYKSLSSEGRLASADRPVSAERDLSRSPTRYPNARTQKGAAAMNEQSGNDPTRVGLSSARKANAANGSEVASAAARQRPGSRNDPGTFMRGTLSSSKGVTTLPLGQAGKIGSRGGDKARVTGLQANSSRKGVTLPRANVGGGQNSSRQPASAMNTPSSDVAANGTGPMSDAIWALRVAASYNGEFKEKELALNNIVREPAPLPALPTRSSSRHGNSNRYIHLFGKTKRQGRRSPTRRGTVEHLPTAGTAAAWPVAGPVGRQWFHETLFSSTSPTTMLTTATAGTMESHNATSASMRSGRKASVPHTKQDLCVLTGLPTAEDQAHGHVLEGQTSYFAAALMARQQQQQHIHPQLQQVTNKAGVQGEAFGATLPLLLSSSSRNEESALGRTRSALPSPPRIPTSLPKRHAIVM